MHISKREEKTLPSLIRLGRVSPLLLAAAPSIVLMHHMQPHGLDVQGVPLNISMGFVSWTAVLQGVANSEIIDVTRKRLKTTKNLRFFLSRLRVFSPLPLTEIYIYIYIYIYVYIYIYILESMKFVRLSLFFVVC